MKPIFAFLSIFCVLLLAGAVTIPASADDGTLPPDSTWDPIVDEDGSIDISGLTDLGVQEVSADWMPSVPVFGDVPATYHLYQDPASGTVYMVPTVTTYLFMAANPDESGLGDAIGALSGNAENSSGYATDAAFLAGIVSGNLDFSDYTEFLQAGYSNWGDLFEAILSGDTDIWSLPAADTFNFLLSMINMSLSDSNMYAVILAFPPGMCDQLPGGCPDGMADATDNSDVIIDPPQCPAPYTTTGPITVSGGPGAGDGGKLAPAHPVVVGQDSQRRGVDIQAWASIPQVVYHYSEAVQHTDYVCVQDLVDGTYGTGCEPPYLPFRLVPHVYWECVAHTRVYTDYLGSATVTLSLTQNSRTWILTDLAQSYPGAHLIHPDFSFSVPGPGTLSDGNVIWSHIFPNIPLADPGWWVVTVRVNTTGTSVSGPRFATVGLGTFLDELVRVTLVGGDMYGGQP